MKLKAKHYLIAIAVLIGMALLLIIEPGKGFKFQNDKNNGLDHSTFSNLLIKHVDSDGGVNYSGFVSDSLALNTYLKQLKQTPPDSKRWTKDERLAYWINVYNAFTIKLIIDNYPISSIRDIGSTIQVPLINTPWDIPIIEIDGQRLTLNDVEHRILRKDFEEPRIHFAIVCASISCPRLRPEAYSSILLQDQLNKQTYAFINDSEKNIIKPNEIKISRIFQWFGGDFKKDGTIIDYLNQFSKIKINTDADLTYLDYDWGINEQKAHSLDRIFD